MDRNLPPLHIVNRQLPEFCTSGRELTEVGGVVVHYFSALNVDPDRMFDPEACRRLFMDLNRGRERREFYMRDFHWPEKRQWASAHIMIDRDGQVIQLVDNDLQAYHAGVSLLNGRPRLNQWTLGVELIGHKTSGFSREQYRSLVTLLAHWEDSYGFPRENVVGHDQVRWNATRAGSVAAPKYDPSGREDGQGENFDWFYLGKLWNDIKPNPTGTVGIEDLEAVIDADPLSHN